MNEYLAFEIAAVGFGIFGAIILALNLPYSKYAYIAFLLSSLASIRISLGKSWAFLTTSICFSIINTIGIVRWLF